VSSFYARKQLIENAVRLTVNHPFRRRRACSWWRQPGSAARKVWRSPGT
jgi:hypothetical protein